ncbi:MAG TPA: ABC transporter permease [Thermomicrobiales bacterium]|jgi:ABC-2 type transport system permease protein|nr:ABC transporter permease [Thermomicrobiales bacterium]
MRFNPRAVMTIFRKDLVDAIRDGRVAIALLLPILIGVSYSYLFNDDFTDETPSYRMVVTPDWPAELNEQFLVASGDAVEVRIDTFATVEDVEERLRDGNADLGLILPPDLVTALSAGQQPAITVVTPATATAGTSYLLGVLDGSLRTVAGQELPAALTVQAAGEPEPSLFDRIGIRNYMLMFSMVFLVGMIAVFAIPIILTEEIEKKTLDALVMIASYTDVMIGKALVGLVYIAVATAITLTLAQASPGDLPLFVLTIAALSASLLGFGLLFGGLFKSANQLNTWGSFILFPIIIPTFLSVVPGIVGDIAAAFPTGAAGRLLADALTGDTIFGNAALYIGIMLVWAVGGFLLLGWQLRRRQA